MVIKKHKNMVIKKWFYLKFVFIYMIINEYVTIANEYDIYYF